METLSDLSAKPKRKQHRRSVSISRATYDRLKAYCQANNASMSGIVEAEVEKFLKDFVPPPRAPEPKPVAAPAPKPAAPAKPPTTAAEVRAALNPPAHIQKKPEPKVEPPKSTLPPSKIFTF